ncbi:hypothetical protein ABZT51_41295 [Streptomyces sp. NPDC005373]|uniref:hypothetical protein n=1 Tax=Streptomyces sp. NPDC005373 TaxID=3156879 RepID=UPI0033B1637A
MTNDELAQDHDEGDGVLVVEPVHDYYLHVLLQMLELDGADSISMTFNVNGGLVYGQMVNRDAWEKLWIEQVDQASDFAGKVLKELASLREARRDDEEDELSRFVHLKNAIFVTGGTRQSLGLWRGPLAQIAGWSNSTPE